MNNLSPELATEPLLFSWDSPRTTKGSAPGLSGAFLIGTRRLLLYFPGGLSADSHASAAAGPCRFDHSCI